MRDVDGDRAIGLFVADYHCKDYHGALHGGAVMTLADIGLGFGVSRAIAGVPCVTVSQQTQFVASTREGDFIICRPKVVRTSKHLVFVRGLITTGDTAVASAEGIWKVLLPRSGKLRLSNMTGSVRFDVSFPR
ncbi:MAG: PaaI family thioesterase [Pseudomonadales bacterium]|nr:PaaI family thioesterase [Pseudomonadales bacterium]